MASNQWDWDSACLTMFGSVWARKILALYFPDLARVSMGLSFCTRGAWGAWLWKEGDKEPIESDRMIEDMLWLLDFLEGNLWV